MAGTNYQQAARQAAQRYGLDPNVFERQIRQESGFNPNARSPAGARGIAQIMPSTARSWGVNPDNPLAALDAAAKNMAQYVKTYGSYRDALVAYNAGPGRVGKSLPLETANYVRTILGGQRTPTATTQAARPDNSRGLAAARWLMSSSSNPLDFVKELQFAQSQQPMGVSQPSASSGAGDVRHRADVINNQKLPYSWGGGHGGKTPLHDAVPLDCSGAVSKALGIDPRVSGAFSKWGKPGDGGDRGITVYSNGGHVLMKIDGRFWGTSASNPGGGAGWIPRSKISPAYLRGFTARHA